MIGIMMNIPLIFIILSFIVFIIFMIITTLYLNNNNYTCTPKGINYFVIIVYKGIHEKNKNVKKIIKKVIKFLNNNL